MIKKSVLGLVLLIILLTANTLTAEIRYNIIDLGTLDGYNISRAWSINNSGQVVGEAVNINTGYNRAVLFDAVSHNIIDLGSPEYVSSFASSINNTGRIVGGCDKNSDPMNPYAVIFDSTGQGNNSAFGEKSRALSINDNGQITGWIKNTSGFERAAILDCNNINNSIQLGTLTGFANSHAYSTNNNNQIIGYAFNDLMTGYRAVRFDSTGQGNNIDLGTLGGQYSAALSINDNDQIAGRADTAAAKYHATLFDSTGSGNNTDLGTIAGYNFSVAISINSTDQIVGQVATDSQPPEFRAVMFDPTGDGNNIDLNNLIDPALGWTLGAATCINNKGWIVGWGVNPQGYGRAFLLKPIIVADFEPDGDTDLADFAVFASAWRSNPADNNWNPLCDISDPNDGVIDELDLAVFARNYLIP